jgi:hypothetical protein
MNFMLLFFYALDGLFYELTVLKALHFCYGVGAFVSPMIAEPFLLNEDCSPFIDNDTSAISVAAAELRLLAPPGSIPLNDTNLPADTLYEAQEMTRVRFAFWIMALVQVSKSTSLAALRRHRFLECMAFR